MMNLLDKYLPVFAPEDGGGTAPSSSGGATSPTSSATPQEASPSSTPSSSSPSPVPAGGSPPAQEAPAAPAPVGGESDSWSSIFEDSPQPLAGEIVQPAPTPPPQAPPVVPPVQPAAAPAQAPSAPEQRTPEAATPQAQPPAAELDRYDPGVLARHLASNEAQALEYVANNVFKLSPQDVEALETNVVEAIPKLLARVFVKSQQNVLSQLASMVPTMIQRQTVAIQKNNENADKFYARWPMIKKAEHGDLVMKYGAVYRQMHPSAGLEQMIEDLGPMILMAGRISPQLAAAAAPPSGQPVNPAAQRAAGNGRSPPPSPFVPAGSAAPTSSATAPEVSPWEAMFRQE